VVTSLVVVFKMSLRGTVAVVTGASRGIGRGIALQLREARAKVYVTGRDPTNRKVDPDLPTLEQTAQGMSCFLVI
jgi:NAD(P)-dependent dehydrogenase (short-subunit alcohol dehydrogenase family)